MRLCIPKIGRAGLGNELFPVAKAFCASAELGLRMVAPRWRKGRPGRDYTSYFPTPLRDTWLTLAGSLQRHQVVFTEADYYETGLPDYGKAARAFLESRGLIDADSLTLYTEGMWGGFLSIWNSRPLVRSMLLKMPFTLRNYYEVASQLDPCKLTVAVNIRMGDFREPETAASIQPGMWNVRLPLSWFESVCTAVSRAFPGDVQFLLITDGTAEECESFLRRLNLHWAGHGAFPFKTKQHELHVCSDLALMADADLLVCSLSAFSLWGAFLSSEHYVWFAPSLHRVRGYLCIWEEDLVVDTAADSGDTESLWLRGVPMGYEEELPSGLKESLEATLVKKASRRGDLIIGGGIPLPDTRSRD